MEVALRKKRYGGWWNGLGQSGETDYEGSGLPGDIDFSSGETDPSLYYQLPGYNIPTAPGVDLDSTELAAEQARARDWLKTLPNILNTATKATLSASQLAAGINAGAVKPSSTCPGGYILAGTGTCVNPTATSPSLVPGFPNSTLLMVGGGFLFLMLLSKGGGRR